jgi:hypothetical protein
VKKRSDSQILADKYIEDIESWGILTLMTKMKDVYMRKLDRERDIILGFQTQNYNDSPLENLDKVRDAFERKYQEEFTKIYNQIKEKLSE